MSYSGGTTREKRDTKNGIVKIVFFFFFKRLFSMFQLKVLDGRNNGRLILAKDDLW